jgi:hypothetical protein
VAKKPCDSAAGANSPQKFAAAGRNSAQRMASRISLDDGSGAEANAALLLALNDLYSIRRGASQDAQSQGGGSRAYGNYAYGAYMSAFGWSLQFSLWGANAYANASLAQYPSASKNTPAYPSIPDDNIMNIIDGYRDQQNDALCTTQ